MGRITLRFCAVGPKAMLSDARCRSNEAGVPGRSRASSWARLQPSVHGLMAPPWPPPHPVKASTLLLPTRTPHHHTHIHTRSCPLPARSGEHPVLWPAPHAAAGAGHPHRLHLGGALLRLACAVRRAGWVWGGNGGAVLWGIVGWRQAGGGQWERGSRGAERGQQYVGSRAWGSTPGAGAKSGVGRLRAGRPALQ